MSQKVQRILEIIRQENIPGNVIKHCSGSLKAVQSSGVPWDGEEHEKSTDRKAVMRSESPKQLPHRGAEQAMKPLSCSLCRKLQASHKTGPKYFETNGRTIFFNFFFFFLAQDIFEVQNSSLRDFVDATFSHAKNR